VRCPFCGTDDTQVVDSRVNDEGNSIRRRRRCSECDKRFTTYESVELTLPQVVKQNGKREDFSRDKLHQSFSRALHKRPVPVEYIEQAIERIIQKVLADGEKEITARELGENVMHELKKWMRWLISDSHLSIEVFLMSNISMMLSAILIK